MQIWLPQPKTPSGSICKHLLFLSIFFIPIATTTCQARCTPELQQRSALDLFDEVVNLYYKQPRNVKRAFELLESGCQCHPDQAALACYNLGVMHELEGQRGAAKEAYQRAYNKDKLYAYELAIQSVDLKPNAGSELQRLLNSMIQDCRDQKPHSALGRLDDWLAANSFEPAAGPPREMLAQPFFEECMGNSKHNKRYQQLLGKLKPSSQSAASLRSSWVQKHARAHPLHSIFDIELYLQKQLFQRDSKHAITRHWQNLVRSARRGQATQSAAHLQQLKASLLRHARKHPADRQSVRAMQRAIALLIQQDAWFAKVRGLPAFQRYLKETL